MLNGKTVAMLVADGFWQIEMTEPRRALNAAGATTAWHRIELASPTTFLRSIAR